MKVNFSYLILTVVRRICPSHPHTRLPKLLLLLVCMVCENPCIHIFKEIHDHMSKTCLHPVQSNGKPASQNGIQLVWGGVPINVIPLFSHPFNEINGQTNRQMDGWIYRIQFSFTWKKTCSFKLNGKSLLHKIKHKKSHCIS